ncbi:hypothetical protein [Sphingopyxis sp. H115]|uniref:hypothetical protein n=1 Tax=Sphingopyxis sp. H115 TaxID=1759073 RepID=UPI0007364BC4|nr:hypothetical protein [Sphingopyxis sp. H115]KTE10756.1 hypothetical protein ATE71_12170 [Sphingopyxis sp. H115]
MANRKTIVAGTGALAALLTGLAWASGVFSPPVLTGPPPPEPRGPFSGCIPTGAGMAARPVDRPRHAGDRYIYRDGTQVRDTDLDGRPAVLLPDGSLRYPDGTTVAHNSDTGETTITHPDGEVTRSNIRMPVLVDGYFVWGDGVRLPGTDPAGGAGKIAEDGLVSFPDGTVVTHDPSTGLTKTRHPDGRITEARDPGTRRNGDGNLQWNDGLTTPPTDPSGGEASATPEGWIRYPDGTMIGHNPATGDTKIIRPDGSIVTHNSDTCETKVIAAAGGCLGAPPVIDQCLIGNWRQTGGGPLEWVQRNVQMGKVQMPRAEVTPLDLTLKSDGSFQTKNGAMDIKFYRPDDPTTTSEDPVTARARGQMAPTTGYWSAKNGEVRACFNSGDRTTGAVTGSTPKHSVTTPFGFPGAAGSDGVVSYTCDGNSFKTSQPMPKGTPMEYSFTRISK